MRPAVDSTTTPDSETRSIRLPLPMVPIAGTYGQRWNGEFPPSKYHLLLSGQNSARETMTYENST